MRRFLPLSFAAQLLASIIVASSGGATQGEARWVIRDLGTLGRGEFFKYQGFSLASAINDRGQIVGWSWRSEDEQWAGSGHAFLWENGKMRDLGALPGLPDSRARDINDQGQIVGESFTFGKDELDNFDRRKGRAVVWEGGRIRTLAGARAQARAINDRGEVVGWAAVGNSGERAVLWQKGKVRRLGIEPVSTLGVDPVSVALDVNERTQVVVISGEWNYAEYALMEVRGFVWQKGTVRDLGKLGWSYANAINDKGQVVGGRNGHATIWTKGVPRRLPGRGRSEADDVNDRGQIVGVVGGRPALWENGKLRLLPGLPGGRGEGEALSINERGQIVGWATTKSIDYSHAVLWTLKR